MLVKKDLSPGRHPSLHPDSNDLLQDSGLAVLLSRRLLPPNSQEMVSNQDSIQV
jgi:hypothetical protein